jgi:hypothetical protein
MKKLKRRYKALLITGGLIAFLGLAGVIGASGCGGSDSATTPTTLVDMREAEGSAPSAGAPAGDETQGTVAEDSATSNAGTATGQSTGVGLGVAQASGDQKIIATVNLEIEVEGGEFWNTLNQARLLAARYGGYPVRSETYSSGEDDTARSGYIEIKIPVGVFDNALADANELGEVKSESISTEDVTDQYVDLQSRIVNAQANVNALLAVLARARTVEEILSVQQTLSYAQETLEQLKGQLRYLENNTSFSTLHLTIYESGAVVGSDKEWGFVQALKDGVHNIVAVFNAVVRGLGWLLPIFLILGLIAYFIYRMVRRASRKNRERLQAGYAAQTGYAAQAPADQRDKEGKTS